MGRGGREGERQRANLGENSRTTRGNSSQFFHAIEHLNKNINSEIEMLKDKIMRLKTKNEIKKLRKQIENPNCTIIDLI